MGQVPTLRAFFAIYTDGAAPREGGPRPLAVEVSLRELPEVIIPGAQDELYGPNTTAFLRFQPKRLFLLSVSRAVSGRAGRFFDEARQVLMEATKGLKGIGLDVLRLWPFDLEASAGAVPEETMAEDVFTLGFRERGIHGFRAETFGLSKLDQREISFEFTGKELADEAFLMCGRLVEWLLEHGGRVQPRQVMSFGFDRLVFLASESVTADPKPFRGWHPPLVERLIPQDLFPGVGVLEIRSQGLAPSDEPTVDLTECLTRSLEQRLLLEDLDLTGDPPHASATATVRGRLQELRSLRAVREEHLDRRDSGWRFERTEGHEGETTPVPLAELTRQVPELTRYLALPWGIRLEWDGEGALKIDTSRMHQVALEHSE